MGTWKWVYDWSRHRWGKARHQGFGHFERIDEAQKR